MTKRLICLLLSVIMLLSCFLTACSTKDTDEAISDTTDEASESTVTLAMYLISENKVSDEQAAAIQEAVNKITKSKFKTQLLMHFLTEDEYYQTIEKAYDDHAAALADPNSALNQSTTVGGEEVTAETVVNEYGIPELKYPTIQDFQVDIFYVSGYERIKKYADDGMLADLTDELDGASKIIGSYISPLYLDYTEEILGSQYIVPMNEPVGEYTYLLLNKELLTKYNYKASDFSSLTAQTTQDFLKLVKTGSSDYTPLKSFTGELDVANMQYFGVDANGRLSNSFSLAGGSYNNSWSYLQEGQYSNFASILNDPNFTSQLQSLAKYKELGYYGTQADSEKDFAVGYIKGGIDVVAQYGDEYELVAVQNPILNTYDLFNNAFAVSSNTVNATRSMEIVTCLYTNAELRNLLLYGIEGVNYELHDSTTKNAAGETIKYVKRLNNNYLMAPEKTGNVILAYPLESDPIMIREYTKQQNLDARASFVIAFTQNYDDMGLDVQNAQAVRQFSEQKLAQIMAVNNVEDLNALLNSIKIELANNKDFAKFTAVNDVYAEDFDETNVNLGTMYETWLLNTGRKVVEEEEE